MKDTHQTINTIEEARRVNNTLWMDILRIAITHAPEETKAVLRQINHNDRFITGMLTKIASS